MNNTQSHNSTSMTTVYRAVSDCRAKQPHDPQRIIVLLASVDFDLPPVYCDLLLRRGAFLMPVRFLDKKRVDLLKYLANRTRVAPLVIVTADVWHCWRRRRPLEAAQIRRRTHLVLELEDPSSDNA